MEPALLGARKPNATAPYFAMALQYKGFRIFTIPRDGGYFARLRKPDLPFSRRESLFIETEVFRCEDEAVQEAKRMVDGGEPQTQS